MPWHSAESVRRSRKLLMSHLSFWQKMSLIFLKRFSVTSQHGHEYTILDRQLSNIVVVDEGTGEVVAMLCAGHYMGGAIPVLPVYDTMLAQKLMLEHNEDEILSVANIFFESNSHAPEFLRRAVEQKRRERDRIVMDWVRMMISE